MMVRGVRGATTVSANNADEILRATRELLQAVIGANQIEENDVASVIFTTTPDLNAVFPAQAARELGWRRVALMGMQEVDVPNGVPLCIRVLIHWNTTRTLDELHHVYLHEAERLRPDLHAKNKAALNGQE